MKRFFLGLITFVLMGAVTFHSCNSKSTCNWPISSTETITFNLISSTIGYNVDIRTKETEGMFVELAGQKANEKVNEKVFQYFKNYCTDKGLVFNNTTMAFVIYYDEHISQSLSITDEHIKGISAYIVEGDKIMHHLYVRDEQSNFSEVENVNVAVHSVTINHIFFYLEKYVFTDVQNVSSILLYSDFGVGTYKNIKKYSTPMRYEVSVRFKAGPTNLEQQGGGGYEDGCRYCGGNDGICDFPPPDPGNPGGGKPICIPSCSGKVAHYGGEQFAYAYDPYLTYAFINDFLPNSDKGRKYIYYYYYLSEEWADNLNVELALQTASVLENFNPVMSAFLEPDKYMDEVMFSNKLSESIFSLLNSYEKITKSSEGKEILNSIREDIKMFSNLKLKEILDILK